MKASAILAVLLSLSTTAFAAPSSEACPSSDAIRVLGLTYTAPTHSGKGEWFGMAAKGSEGKIKRFDSAIFYPAEGTATERGELAQCSYILDNGIVDMRFKPASAHRALVSLSNVSSWEKMEGPFGIIYYECKGPESKQCQFQELGK